MEKWYFSLETVTTWLPPVNRRYWKLSPAHAKSFRHATDTRSTKTERTPQETSYKWRICLNSTNNQCQTNLNRHWFWPQIVSRRNISEKFARRKLKFPACWFRWAVTWQFGRVHRPILLSHTAQQLQKISLNKPASSIYLITWLLSPIFLKGRSKKWSCLW